MHELEKLVLKYGSDKNLGEYTLMYKRIFPEIKSTVTNVLEIGIGTLMTGPSSFAGITGIYPHYTPGGSLRVWRDYFPNAQVYGIDIAEDCMFEEERIKTFLFDSTDKEACDKYLQDDFFDIIIDDGDHNSSHQVKTLENLFPKLKDGGYYIIEDIGGGTNDPGFHTRLADVHKITLDSDLSDTFHPLVIHKK